MSKIEADKASIVINMSATLCCTNYHTTMTVYMYGKKNKKKNKNYYRNNVILSL